MAMSSDGLRVSTEKCEGLLINKQTPENIVPTDGEENWCEFGKIDNLLNFTWMLRKRNLGQITEEVGVFMELAWNAVISSC
jgi:hypothetical protein